MKMHRINTKLVPVKIHYFIFMAGLACALPFRTVFAKQLGISATAVGVIFLAVPFLKIITNPLFGFILDYFKKFRLTIAVLLLIVAISHIAMVFIPPVSPEKAENSASIRLSAKLVSIPHINTSKKSENLPIILQRMLNASKIEDNPANERKDGLRFFKVKEYEINLRTSEKHIESFMEVYPCKDEFECVSTQCISKYPDKGILVEIQRDEFVTVQFWGIFLLMALSSVTFCAVMFLMDTICYEMLYDTNETYGVQRLWGTIGWGLGALAGGYLNQIISPDPSNIDYAPSFYLLAIVTILDLVPLYFIEVGNVKYSSNICKDVGFLLSKLHVVINIAIVFMVGVLSGLIWNYQFWFMEEIGASQILLGLSQTFECLLAELPCFIVSGWIIRKLGYNHCNSITFLCFGLRYLCFAYMYNPWMTLPLALLHGPTFGLFYASMITYGKSEAPPGTEATVQALLSMSFEGVANRQHSYRTYHQVQQRQDEEKNLPPVGVEEDW
ncbi:major facilitator superfamily domain-containing protein 6-like [Uloborus diversus]|uniref:major facilitator superfamily domain-containing protein 6-like n=1 Tax=Uloborus diversus TaxID=327109 RepID=UPI002408FC57|nr:major facilitator superfamily domain-containing protein 6-like [Uloborus diversus]